MSISTFSEAVQQTAPKVDREAGVIRGVKIIGRESKNGRTYSEAALEQAAKLYEGIGVNVDHRSKDKPHEDRKLSDGFGRLCNVVKREDGVYGDLHYLKSHPLAEQICEAAETMPDQLGLSHDASGSVRRDGDRWIVETVEDVRSVDLVRNPATNAGLFESHSEVKTVKKSFRAIFKEAVISKGRQLSERGFRVLREMDEEGMMAVDEPVEVPEEEPADPVAMVKDQMMVKVAEIFKDDSIDPKTTGKKIEGLAKAVESVKAELAGEQEAPAEVPEEEMTDEEKAKKAAEMEECEDDMKESAAVKKLNKDLAEIRESLASEKAARERAERDTQARKLCLKSGVEPSEILIESLVGLATPEKMEAFLESYPKGYRPSVQHPRSQQPLRESDSGKKPYDDSDLKSVAKFLRT